MRGVVPCERDRGRPDTEEDHERVDSEEAPDLARISSFSGKHRPKKDQVSGLGKMRRISGQILDPSPLFPAVQHFEVASRDPDSRIGTCGARGVERGRQGEEKEGGSGLDSLHVFSKRDAARAPTTRASVGTSAIVVRENALSRAQAGPKAESEAAAA